MLQDNTYKYDNVGNIISIDDNGLNTRNQYFEYDNINRLIYSKGGMNCQGTGIGYETDYTYSVAGRILRKNVTSQRMSTTAGVYPVDYQNSYTYPSTGNPFAISSVQDALSGSVNNLEWDANGNLINSSCISGPAYDRSLCWTEDNRLQGYTEYSDDNGGISAWYNYAAGGDRNFKVTTPRIQASQNAAALMQHASLAYPTLYASALITFNKGGYTKHYFEGTNRVCSRIGGGFYHVSWNSIENRVPAFAEGYDQLSEGQRESVEHTFNDCLGIAVDVDGIVDLYDVIKHETERHDPEPAFYYHSDHLGSAAYLTNDAGQVTQTLNYLPYGEDWVDIQNYAETRYPRLGIYTYNGKEKDYESGFHYYGARYYWSELLTGWLSVDPMMDKYPGISPYNYCMWNPVKLVDPDGRDGDVEVNKDDRSIIVNMNIYYNKTQKNIEYITGREGEDDYNQLDRARQKGFSSKDSWKHIDDDGIEWSVTININFIEKESEEEVQTALENDPVGNKLCIDREYGEAGNWDPNTRTITLGYGSWSRMAIENDAGTLSHEIGHALGLTHPDNTHKGESGDYGIMSYSLNRTVWGSEVSRVASRILKSASNSQDSQVRLHLFGSPIREPSIQTSKK